MLRTAGWLTRAIALVVVGVGTFLHSSATTSVLAAQAAAFGLGVAMMGVWAVSDFRRPATAAHDRVPPSPLALAALALAAAAGGVCASPGGAGLIAFGIMTALAAGSETSLITGWVITAIGAVAIEVGVLVWSASTATALGFPLALIVALLSGQTRRAYRLQAEQSAALLAQVEQLRAEQRQVAVLNERTRIAREIHDVLAHSLGALGIQLQAARAVLSDQRDVDRALGLLDQAQRIAGDGLGETRRAIHALRSGAGPLPQELTRLAEAYHTRHQMPVTVSVNGDVRTLPPDAALALLRTAQESLVNAAKHGDGHAAGINLSFDAGQTTLTVASPLAGEHSEAEAEAEAGAGTGAGAGALRSPMETADSGYGLMGLRERLLLLGGTLTAGPRDGQWIVTAQVPR
jgi:signal transduction histidine kinase